MGLRERPLAGDRQAFLKVLDWRIAAAPNRLETRARGVEESGQLSTKIARGSNECSDHRSTRKAVRKLIFRPDDDNRRIARLRLHSRSPAQQITPDPIPHAHDAIARRVTPASTPRQPEARWAGPRWPWRPLVLPSAYSFILRKPAPVTADCRSACAPLLKSRGPCMRRIPKDAVSRCRSPSQPTAWSRRRAGFWATGTRFPETRAIAPVASQHEVEGGRRCRKRRREKGSAADRASP